MRQAIIWHPIADAGEAVSSDTATRGGGGGGATRELFAATQENIPLHVLTGDREAVSEERNSMSRRGQMTGRCVGAGERGA